MHMRKNWFISCWAVCVLLFSAWTASAQTDGTYGGYTPYSVFGVGNMHQKGTAWNRSMGGVGIAARSTRFINTLNPASATARDSLSFMADFGVSGRMSVFSEEQKLGLNTTVNIDDFVMSFPLWKHTAMMVGLVPLSDVGYKISSTEVDYTGTRTFVTQGNGGIYQVFAAASATLWNRLSLGAQFNYNFGNINKVAALSYDDASFRSMASGDSLQVRNLGVTLGLQYEQPLSTTSALTVGATYRFSTPMNGYRIHYRERGSYDRTRGVDTLGVNVLRPRIGDELGVGLSYRVADRFLAEVDYTRANWASSNLDAITGFSNTGLSGGKDVVFGNSVGQSVRAGVEWTPNRNDIRYYLRTCTYRVGAYFDQSYYTVDGQHVNAVGVTLGMTLPVFRWKNGFTVGLDFGRRGLASSQVKETYFGFNLGLNVYDIWFQKRAFE